MEKNKVNYIVYILIFCVVLAGVGGYWIGTCLGDDKKSIAPENENNIIPEGATKKIEGFIKDLNEVGYVFDYSNYFDFAIPDGRSEFAYDKNIELFTDTFKQYYVVSKNKNLEKGYCSTDKGVGDIFVYVPEYDIEYQKMWGEAPNSLKSLEDQFWTNSADSPISSEKSKYVCDEFVLENKDKIYGYGFVSNEPIVISEKEITPFKLSLKEIKKLGDYSYIAYVNLENYHEHYQSVYDQAYLGRIIFKYIDIDDMFILDSFKMIK